MDEVTVEAAAEAAAPRATIKACFVQASLRRHISRLVSLLAETMPVSWLLLLSRECIFQAFIGVTKSTSSPRPPGPVGMIN